jgi:anhydro-N-acetylmuramic acid kinase
MTLHVGVLSGTSMDAVDAVLADVSEQGVRVEAWQETPVPPTLARRLEKALDTPRLTALECWRLDAEVGELFAIAVSALLRNAGVASERVAAIGSHGQTLYHAPDARPPLTVQVGDPNVIAQRTGIPVVADFRRMDLAAGGQGAPLAPTFHAFAFSDPHHARAVLNVGGIANLTALPSSHAGTVLGFDTGPGNTLMDLWATRHTGERFDRDGRLAAAGASSPELLAALLADPYFQRPPPKSTGREHFNAGWLDARLAARPEHTPADVQRTLLELTVESAARAVEGLPEPPPAVFVCGGGALNPVLMQRLGERLAGRRVASTESLGVPPKTVEGAAFAWLAWRRLAARAGALPSVTGAYEAGVLGGVYRSREPR